VARKRKSSKSDTQPAQLMVVNDVPGEECRIAILENGRLEELYSERTSQATNVGNIYKGRVVNVEPAIQAAFVDYGQGQNGFLHISDLHPRYFPGGEDKTERVGKKIPRRDRPPIQEALKRGDSILVQVIKQGIGTKGPTLTSYLSIPGRLMVMMPDMDKVGVSRRIEDEEKRRAMRKILDSLDLPEGYGFILRTAGFDRTKTELKRDLAYLTRLWKQLEKRIDKIKAPCALYVESDILIRTIRDILAPDIDAIVVDSESGYKRAADFLQVMAPRSAPRLIRYQRQTPIFHAFDIEQQIDLIHKREVPLPSGGAIVIDQTEALVAIDVNSGRSRGARDAETNAYRTNCEAVDEICRQLRLRDLGGLIVHDLIDMYRQDNRKSIEKRFRDNLARDRARTTITRISEFGVLEMTRQRMRPSMRKSHYQPCTCCAGRGEVRTPESMTSEALRFIAYLLQFDRVQSVELVCSVRMASTLLSGKRRELVRLEDAFEKKIRIRVSESIETDRVDYYAYDERNADIDISKLPSIKAPSIETMEKEAAEAEQEEGAEDEGQGRSKRRRRRGKKVASLESTLRSGDLARDLDELEEDKQTPQREDVSPNGEAKEDEQESKPKKRRRRRRGGRGRGRSRGEAKSTEAKTDEQDRKGDGEPEGKTGDEQKKPAGKAADAGGEDESKDDGDGKKSKSRRRRRRRSRSKSSSEGGGESKESKESKSQDDQAAETTANESGQAESKQDSPGEDAQKKTKKKRRRKSEASKASEQPSDEESGKSRESRKKSDDADAPKDEKPKKKRRSRSRKSGPPADNAEKKQEDAGGGKSKADKTAEPASAGKDESKTDESSSGSAPRPRRTLYRSRRRISPEVAREVREQSET